jgi:DNA-binding CsgD family transcriptional regulator
MLARLGLSERAERVYRTMLTGSILAAADVAVQLRLTEHAVRKAFEQLTDLDLLRRGPHGGFRLADPEAGLAALLVDAEEEVRLQLGEIEVTRTAIAAITSDGDACRRAGIDGTQLDGADAVRARLTQLTRHARTELWSFTQGGAHRPAAIRANKVLNEAALDRGVDVRCVLQEACRNSSTTVAYARWLISVGGQVRTTPGLPIRLTIIDRQVAILPINPVDLDVGGLEVRNPGLLVAICALFEQVWSTATPLGTEATRNRGGLSPHEREVFKLLGEGYTDASVAARLSMSVRTVRRTIADLTARLDATSRFQAGVNAAHNAWI